MNDKNESEVRFEALLARARKWLSNTQMEMIQDSWKYDSESNGVDTLAHMLNDIVNDPEADALQDEAYKWLADEWPNHPSLKERRRRGDD